MSRLNIFVKILILGVLVLLRNVNFFVQLEKPWVVSVLHFLIFLFALNILLSVFLFVYKKRIGLRNTDKNNVTLGTRNIYYLIVSLSIVGFILSLVGVEFGTLFTSLSIIAAAIAILTKEYISPIIAGFHIALSNTISINDHVKIGELKGKVVDIRLTKLKLLSEEDELIIISNEKAYFSEIINYTKGDVRNVSIGFDLNPGHFDTIETLEAELIEEVKEYAEYIKSESYYLRVDSITNEVISFKFQYELKKSGDREHAKDIRRKTVRKVINSIKQNATSKTI